MAPFNVGLSLSLCLALDSSWSGFVPWYAVPCPVVGGSVVCGLWPLFEIY